MTKRKCRRTARRQSRIPNPSTAVCVEGQCRRSVSTRPTRPTRTYGLPFRSILLYTHRYGCLLFSVLDFGAIFILPIALPADGAVSAVCVYATYARQNREYPQKPRCIYTVSILYRDFQGLSGILRDIWEVLQGNSASLRAPGAQSAAVKNCPHSQPLALGPPAAERENRGPGDNGYICEPSSQYRAL